MFGRSVTVDGKVYFIPCCPDTPYSQILARASRMAEREKAAKESALLIGNQENR